jgi:hypothetical protein
MSLFNYFKFYKHSHSKITDHIPRETRHGKITRNHAIYLVKKMNKNIKI